ncbi:MAG: hypothetical protein IKP02_11785 [Paludibacteraceae bacterium]|nr:hypothetical protein [Paludibacteraceae bacterium]
MIIASKGHVRLKGKGGDIISEFATIAAALLDFEEVTPDILKSMIDVAKLKKKEDTDNE